MSLQAEDGDSAQPQIHREREGREREIYFEGVLVMKSASRTSVEGANVSQRF